LSAFPVSSAYGFDRGFDRFDCPEGALETGPAGNPTWNLSALQRRADATTDRAIEEVRDLRAPFFLWVHYFDPHDAVLLPPASSIPAGVAIPAAGTIDLTREMYDVEVRYVDAQLARLVAALEESGAWENTIVVVVADHGEGLGDHDWHAHRLLYQEQIRVPLLLRLPSRSAAPRGGVVTSLVRTTDILPTILDYLGIASPQRIDGSSLRGLVEGRAEAPRRALADAINGYDENALGIRSRPLDDFLYAAMDARWKLVYRPNHPEASELFDLEEDPAELRNRHGDEPGKVLELERLLASSRPFVDHPFPAMSKEGGALPQPGSTRSVEATRRSLAGLGYAGGGEIRTVEWAWTCPAHPGFRSEGGKEDPRAGRACAECGSPLLLVRR
jgi:arylsulfatase A-like enzyme